MDVTQPRLGWQIRSGRRAEKQTAYQVLVASSEAGLRDNQGDLWDTGRIESDQSIQVTYAGRPLASRLRCHWKVRVWGLDGTASSWSPPASWTMGLLAPEDWQAKWIADAATVAEAQNHSNALPQAPNSPPAPKPAVLFRKTFELDASVKRATAYVTGLGLYELRLNGRRVGDDLLAPEWTSYRNRVQYQTYAVTGLLRPGANALGAVVGEGWFMGRLMGIAGNAYGAFPRFLLQFELELADDRRQLIVTGPDWQSTTEGPIRAAGLYDGETYDARLENRQWDTPGFDKPGWKPVRVLEPEPARLVWQRNEPIRVNQELRPVLLTEPKPGVYVFDFAQNLVGWCRLKVTGAPGTSVTLRHAEMTNPDGTVYTANLRGAPQVDRFILRGNGEETFEPHFTYHGFRYVELTGLRHRPRLGSLVAKVIHSAAPEAGRFECSNPAINQLMRNILWTERANLMSAPTDCPQRDERFGWMGDIQAFSQTAIFNLNLAPFLSKWLQDVRDDQAADGRFPDYAPHPGDPNAAVGAPAWADAGVIVPWRVYQNYADRRLLADHFDAARRWIEHLWRLNPDLIWAKGRNNDYNDWLNGDWIRQRDWPPKGASVPNDVFATAFFAHSAELVGRMAEVLGRHDEALRCLGLAQKIRTAFNERFVKPDGRIEGGTQAGYALALAFDLLPPQLRPKAARRLVEGIGNYHGHSPPAFRPPTARCSS